MSELSSHWETIFTKKSPTEVSWYQPHLAVSLRLIRQAAPSPHASIIDIGGGDSSLVDDLLSEGCNNVSVLDISEAALSRSKIRLGERSEKVNWIQADITGAALPSHSFDLWHDRAMFHFLIAPELRSAYFRTCRHAVKPGGMLIVATFAPDGPDRCSGLPTMRYGPEELEKTFGSAFRLKETVPERHVTPHGKSQNFIYAVLKKQAEDE
ncbi:MAG: class I SAM-dependent methyltransferase [Bacteroidota bacterium]